MNKLFIAAMGIYLLCAQHAYGQAWQVSGSDLQTDGSTDNVHVVNNLGVGVAPMLQNT